MAEFWSRSHEVPGIIVSKHTTKDANKVYDDNELRLENQLIFAVYNNANKVARLLRPRLDPFGLTFPQYLTMLALWGHPPCTVSDLSRSLNLESNTLTPLLKRLEATGYITRQRDRDDERCVRIHLTPKGEAFRVEAGALRKSVIRQLALPEEDMASLKSALRHLSHRLDTVIENTAAAEPSPVPSERHADHNQEY